MQNLGEELPCRFKIDMINLTNFYQSTSKSQKVSLKWAPFEQSIYWLSEKGTEKFSFMTLKADAKFRRKMTCRFKTDIRNLANFDPGTWKSQKVTFNWQFLNYSMVELKAYLGVIFHDTED